jgi:hypothetical protein
MIEGNNPLPWIERAEEDYAAVQVRYPGDIPTIEDAREAVIIARSVRQKIRKLLDY